MKKLINALSMSLFSVALAQAENLSFEQMEVSIDPKSLSTGIGIRDKHMHDLIFKDGQGALPPIVFRSTDIRCGGADCTASGTLSIRNHSIPMKIPLKYRRKSALAYDFEGESRVKLTDFKIPLPSYMGIGVEDEVSFKFKLEVTESGAGSARQLQIKSGSAEFTAKTNMLGMDIEGSSQQVAGSAKIQAAPASATQIGAVRMDEEGPR